MDILTNVLNLDEQKTTAKAAVTVFFYLSVTFALDAVLLFMFQADPESADILQYVQRFSPSLFIGTALTVMVLFGRIMPLWIKIAAAALSVAGGYFLIGAVSILPLAIILKMPVEDEALNLPNAPEDEVMHTSLSPAVQAPQDIQGEVKEAAFPMPDFSSHEDAEGVEGDDADGIEDADERESEDDRDDDSEVGDDSDEDEDEEKKPARPMGDGEVPDGYVDPIDDFLKDE